MVVALCFSTTSQKRRVGRGRQAFEQDAGDAVAERAVDDVAVARDPADVGGAEVDVVVVEVEDVFGGVVYVEQVAAAAVQDALGRARRARGVEDEERVLGIDRYGWAVGGDVGAAISSWYQTSRPAVMGTSPSTRLMTMTVSTVVSPATAMSALTLLAVVLPPR